MTSTFFLIHFFLSPLWYCLNVSSQVKNVSLLSFTACCVRENTTGHHKRLVTHDSVLCGSKMQFPILAIDKYVPNKNKPFLHGMLQQSRLCLSVRVFQTETPLLKVLVSDFLLEIFFFVSNGSKAAPWFNRIPSSGSSRQKFVGPVNRTVNSVHSLNTCFYFWDVKKWQWQQRGM